MKFTRIIETESRLWILGKQKNKNNSPIKQNIYNFRNQSSCQKKTHSNIKHGIVALKSDLPTHSQKREHVNSKR